MLDPVDAFNLKLIKVFNSDFDFWITIEEVKKKENWLWVSAN